VILLVAAFSWACANVIVKKAAMESGQRIDMLAFIVWSSLHAAKAAHWDAWAALAPYALLVPVFGMGSSALLLGEPLPAWKFYAAALVLGGIATITLMPLVSGRSR
jgi:O-acetylserine/cysteine efflux transporter